MLETRDRLNKILAKHTGQSVERIKHDTDRDRFMDSVEAGRALMDEDLRVRQREPLPGRAARQQQRSHAHRNAHADGLDVGLDELHRVVDRQARVDAAAR